VLGEDSVEDGLTDGRDATPRRWRITDELAVTSET